MRSNFKNGFGPLVAITLLLVVSVISVIGFNSWYTTYQNNIIANSNYQSKQILGDSLEIVDIIGKYIYIKSENKT